MGCMQQYGSRQEVCGSDNVTYDSDCMLATANCNKLESEEITKLHDGACLIIIEPCPLCMVHPKFMRPVCGRGNIVLNNLHVKSGCILTRICTTFLVLIQSF